MGWLALLILRKRQCESLSIGIGAEKQTPTSFLFPNLNRIINAEFGSLGGNNNYTEMKKNNLILSFAFLLIGLFCVGLSSCGSDDDEGGSIDQNLVGTWYRNGSSYTAGWRFNANGTCIEGEWSRGGSERFNTEREASTHWSTNGNKLTVRGDGETWSYIYSISNDGNTLTLTEADDDSDFGGTYTKKK